MKSHSMGVIQGGGHVYLYLSIMSTSSLPQNTVQDLPSGPEPPFFNITNFTLVPAVTSDRTPVNKKFGDVLQEVRQHYRVVRASSAKNFLENHP